MLAIHLKGDWPNDWDAHRGIFDIVTEEKFLKFYTIYEEKTYFACCFNCFTQRSARGFAVEHVRYIFVLGRMHDERTLLNVFSDPEKAEIPYSAFG